MTFVTDAERPHLGGSCAGGDPATWYPHLWRWLVDEYGVRSVLDVGCGDGYAVDYFVHLGCDRVLGIDGLVRFPVEVILRWDYTKGPAPVRAKFDLCWSCEFVEHVEERYLPNFLHSFQQADLVLMTHALPGQPGWHHVNCREPEYWKGVMAALGYGLNSSLTAVTRELAAANANPLNHYAQRGLAFERK